MNGSQEILKVISDYDNDVKQILTDHSCVDYMYALSDIRENLLEWYPFKREARLLQVGADFGALTGLYSRRVRQVTVLDEDPIQGEILKRRYPDRDNIRFFQTDLGNYTNEDTEGYDYVVMAGTLKLPYSGQITAAKKLLKPGGELIVAVCNQFGLKYWAGVKKDDCSFSRDDIGFLLTRDEIESGRQSTLTWYYPMPDYRLPTTVYSKEYLPKKGDLTFMLTAYDYPEYLLMNVGAAFDTVCEDEQFETFANSFLIIWR